MKEASKFIKNEEENKGKYELLKQKGEIQEALERNTEKMQKLEGDM